MMEQSMMEHGMKEQCRRERRIWERRPNAWTPCGTHTELWWASGM